MNSDHGFWWFIKVVIAVVIGMWIYQNAPLFLPGLSNITNKLDSSVSAISDYNPLGHDSEVDAIAKQYGVTPEYDYQKVYQHCYSDDSHNDNNTLASFCAATPDVIYINKFADAWDQNKREGGIDDVMRHELSHRAIFKQCGTTNPTVIARLGANTENTASSYAVKFLGADINQLDQLGNNNTSDNPYTMTDASDQAAETIHNGQCN